MIMHGPKSRSAAAKAEHARPGADRREPAAPPRAGKKPQRNHNNAGPAAFYAELLRFLNKLKLPFRVGGTFAMNVYVGFGRETKDIDVFCRAGDYPRILKACAEAGFQTEVEDERWIAKVRKGKHFCDIIFGSANMAAPITEEWLKETHHTEFFGVPVKLLPPTELIWSKVFIMDRHKYDGNDVAHIILKQHKQIDWRRLLRYMDQHWEVLLMHILKFRYVYPSERERIPGWLVDELIARLEAQRRLPTPQTRVCRGRIFSRSDYLVDITDWGFADLVGDHKYA